MNDIRKLQLRALDRIGHFLALLEHATNEFDIEAQTYTIMRAAESLYKQMHAANSVTKPEFQIDVTHVHKLADGRTVSMTEKRPLSEMMDTIANIPKLWAHKHYEDENENEWDVDFVESCDVCKDRMELAVEEGRACAKHPLAYFEPAGSGGSVTCAKCGSPSVAGSDVCHAHGGMKDKRPAYCERCDDEKNKPVQS